MEAGKLRHRITVQRNLGATANSVGEIIADWQDLYSDVPASVEPLKGREFYAARQFNAEVTHKIILRHEGRAIRPSDRVLFGSRFFDINAATNPGEQNVSWELLCTETI